MKIANHVLDGLLPYVCLNKAFCRQPQTLQIPLSRLRTGHRKEGPEKTAGGTGSGCSEFMAVSFHMERQYPFGIKRHVSERDCQRPRVKQSRQYEDFT